MIEIIKNKIWNLLKDKEASGAIICDKKGEILWHKGMAIKVSLGANGESEAAVVSCTGSLSNFAMSRPIKNLYSQPLNSNYFLHILRGRKSSFSESELKTLKALGEIVVDMIALVKKKEEEKRWICGKSERMKKVRELVLNYSMEKEPVLLLGETGVGKNITAELIHSCSRRKGKFVVAGAPNLQENLFESILFGHKKGAFTDAKFDRKGLVEEAEGGTIFIDEISEVPVSMQAKLLRFIESKKYRVLGETFEREAEVRIIAASNKDLFKAIKNKEFRKDLYYRLNILEITLPPLRECKEDIESFVKEKQHYLKGKEIGKGFMEALYNHDWPGNFRELITVLKRVGICSKSPITGKDIENIIIQDGCNKVTERQIGKIDQIWEAIKSGKTFWEVVKEPFLARDLNRAEVREIVNQGLSHANGRYKNLIRVFNLTDGDYHKFMTFLQYNKLRSK
jgi:transcriptional regulator with PAS, ATPase and Fis domain